MVSKALVITEDEDLAEQIISQLHDLPYQFVRVPTFLDSLDFFAAGDIGLTIIERSSPWEDSIQALCPLRLMYEGSIVVMLYGGDDRDKAHYLGMADECIWLPLTTDGIAAIKTIVSERRSSALPNNTKRPFYYCRGLLVFPEQSMVFYGEYEIRLTHTEYEILYFLIRHRNSIVSRGQILHGVWPHGNAEENEKSVNIHIYSIRHKLELRTDEPFIITERGFGYRFVTERPKVPAKKVAPRKMLMQS